jgi:peptidoglycan-N-acetylglucosamine deacetylase
MKAKFLVMAFLVGVLLAATAFIYLRYLHPDYAYRRPAQAAFVISFDDQYITEWYEHRDLFKKYAVQATFFITAPHSLTPEELSMLRSLVADGHEVGSHGAHHVNALQYSKEHGLANYIQHEVVPAINTLQVLGFTPVTFAYPYGANSRHTDHELSKYFYLLRGDSWKVEGKSIDELDRIFYNYDGRRVINGLGIDHGSGVTIQDIKLAFTRAASRNEAVILYAHAINNSNKAYSISPAMLEKVFVAARQQHLTSLTFKNLVF